MSETSIKLILEFIIPRLIWMMNKQSLTEKEALAIECPRIIFFMVSEKETGHITYPEEAKIWVTKRISLKSIKVQKE